jgi:outer membrane receptor for ferrienterochelin and colicins
MRTISVTKISAALLLLGSLHLDVHSACAEENPAAASRKLKKLSIEELMEVEVETVYGASRYEQKVTEAPSSVTIVTADMIRKFGYRTLADLLRSVRGFYVTNDRNYSYIGVRGFGRPGDYNSRILVQVDGHRINDNVYDEALVGEDFIIDIDLIERVEIIRGPSSSLYGSSAFFAVINIITRRGHDFNGFEASAAAGSLDTYKGRVSYGKQFLNGLEIVASGSGLDSDGNDHLFYREYDAPETNNGVTDDTDYEHAYNFFSRLSFRDFTLEGAYVSREKGIPTGAFDTDFNDSHNRSVDEHGYVDLRYDKELAEGLGIVGRLFYDVTKYKGDYIYSGVDNRDTDRGEWWGAELTGKKTFLGKHTLIMGAEYQGNFRQDQKNYDREPYALYLDDRRDGYKWGLYAQGEIALHRKLTLNLGVRWDYFDTFGSTTNPRLALIYKPFDKSVFKFMYGEAFRAPNAYELYYSDSGLTAKASNNLDPETIRTYEIVYEQRMFEHLQGTVSGFYYDTKDLITLTTDPADDLLVFKNVDRTETIGVEVELRGKWENGLEAWASYSYQDSENKSTDKTLTNSPMHLAKANVIIPILRERLFAAFETQYTGTRKTLKGNNADDFIVANLTIFGQSLVKGLDLSATIYNIFDEGYGDPASEEHRQDIIKQDGRAFRVKLTYRF